MSEVTAPENLLGCPRARAEGALLGLACGDALGWPQEFPSADRRRVAPSPSFAAWPRRGGGRYYGYTELIAAGEYSDDTQLTLAVARSRLAGPNWWSVFTRTELPLWTLYERGGGGATKRAAEAWLRGIAPWKQREPDNVARYFRAGGNGVAMRVLPHVIAHAGDPDALGLVREVLVDGVATHGHPRALVGAAAYAFAALFLVQAKGTLGFGALLEAVAAGVESWGIEPPRSGKGDWHEAAEHAFEGGLSAAWRSTVGEMLDLLSVAAQGISDGALSDDDDVLRKLGAFGKAKGAGTVSAAAAIYLLSRFAAQPTGGVVKAAFAVGSDTDTVAAMTGGLAGCLGGTEWMPSQWLQVQDAHYIRGLANQLASRTLDANLHASRRPVDRRATDQIQARLSAGSRVPLDLDGRLAVEILDDRQLNPLAKTTRARRWTLRTGDGQTLYVVKVGRVSSSDAAATPDSAITSTTETKGVAQVHARLVRATLVVGDLAAAARFYEEVLGLAPSRRVLGAIECGPVRLVTAAGGAVLPAAGGGTGPHSVTLAVRDLAPIRRAAERFGAQGLAGQGDADAHRIVLVDPSGNVVEVIQDDPSPGR